jgi:hypothetical protein
MMLYLEFTLPLFSPESESWREFSVSPRRPERSRSLSDGLASHAWRNSTACGWSLVNTPAVSAPPNTAPVSRFVRNGR